MATIVVSVGHVFERCCFEARVFHARNVAPSSCGLLVYNSYSVWIREILYVRESVPR